MDGPTDELAEFALLHFDFARMDGNESALELDESKLKETN